MARMKAVGACDAAVAVGRSLEVRLACSSTVPAATSSPASQAQIQSFYDDNATEDNWTCIEIQLDSIYHRATWRARRRWRRW